MSRGLNRHSGAGDAAVVADRLHSAAIHLLRRVRRRDPETGVGPARLSALSVVVFGGPLTLGALAAAEQVRPPTMSRLVAGLEADGLVRRQADPDDRRIVWMHATPKGERVLQEGRRRRVADLAALLRRLSRHDLRTLAEAITHIERALAANKKTRK